MKERAPQAQRTRPETDHTGGPQRVSRSVSEGGSRGVRIRSMLLAGLTRWLSTAGMTQTEAAKELGVTQARISDIKRGKINQFSLDLLVRLAARAGLHPRMELAA